MQITPPVVAEHRSHSNVEPLVGRLLRLLATQMTSTMSESYDQVADSLQRASRGFDHLFQDEIADAKTAFQEHANSPIHLLGLGVCSFLEASLGMEVRFQNARLTF